MDRPLVRTGHERVQVFGDECDAVVTHEVVEPETAEAIDPEQAQGVGVGVNDGAVEIEHHDRRWEVVHEPGTEALGHVGHATPSRRLDGRVVTA